MIKRRRSRKPALCKQCGEPVGRDADGKPLRAYYCSDSCKARFSERKSIDRRGQVCEICGVTFVSSCSRPQKTCSIRCHRERVNDRKKLTECQWCGKQFSLGWGDKNAHCSADCRYRKPRLIAWARTNINAWVKKLRATAPLKPYVYTWEKWCENVASGKHAFTPLTVQQLWRQKTQTIVTANRHRLRGVRTPRNLSTPNVDNGTTWDSIANEMAIVKTSRKDRRWALKIGNLVSNSVKRMRRKGIRQ